MAGLGLLYEDGAWIWDHSIEGLRYDKKVQKTEKGEEKDVKKEVDKYILAFNDNVDSIEMAKFRHKYQRHCKPGRPEVITIQDIKDVAIFTANQAKMTYEFLNFFHIPTVDRFLRALIVYFDYYIKVFDLLTYRRGRMNRKLRNPSSVVIEKLIADELGDYRAMIGREYCNMILGAADCYPYHHLSNKNRTSMTKKDARLTDLLLSMAMRVVWLTMNRQNYNLIEVEIHRLFRTEFYNVIVHRQIDHQQPLPQIEEYILHGPPPPQKKLLRRTPACEEILKQHDFRLIGAGVVKTDNLSEKLVQMQAAYLLPEHELISHGFSFGILGRPRSDFDPMLMELSKEEKEGSLTKLLKVIDTQESELSIVEDSIEEEISMESLTIESSLSYLSGYGKSIVVELDPDIEEEHKEKYIEEEQSKTTSESVSEEYVPEMPPMPVDTSICKLDAPSHLFYMPTEDDMFYRIPSEFPSADHIEDEDRSAKQQLLIWLKRKRAFEKEKLKINQI
ncbi:uncharacterized protein LOC113383053 [Ctenocephalides felis]|uniref:uncharacterized protein LOC113383053 n=1 Tax=Ctenocephalides felis TaxID=7515 RepID=UPI000E6E5A1B|nr:uncharacterized protein LOC113383053 [Ctenocephalides felis]